MPDGYVAAGQVVSALVKFVPRLSSCWTPVSGSMDSIVEEDEEEEERTDVIRLTGRECLCVPVCLSVCFSVQFGNTCCVHVKVFPTVLENLGKSLNMQKIKA